MKIVYANEVSLSVAWESREVRGLRMPAGGEVLHGIASLASSPRQTNAQKVSVFLFSGVFGEQ